MAILNVIKVNDDVDGILRKVCKPVEKFDTKLHKLLDDMHDTMLNDDILGGLAAPQVGVLKRVIVINVNNFYIELVNPEIIAKSDKMYPCRESCASVPGVRRRIARPRKVTVQYFDREGNKFSIESREWMAHLFQHELDHLDGILLTDRPETLPKEQQNQGGA
ncbi:MAG: peptide deformylase [Christensenellaceae bacterium]|jgi:peptide deformylase|nr:peptide deformylase [Christensenellaceae bacterium]